MQLAATQLAHHLQKGLRPLYTLHGDEALLVQEAADCAWALFIQRDFLGLRSDHHLTGTYKIPREVMIRVGVFAKSRRGG